VWIDAYVHVLDWLCSIRVSSLSRAALTLTPSIYYELISGTWVKLAYSTDEERSLRLFTAPEQGARACWGVF